MEMRKRVRRDYTRETKETKFCECGCGTKISSINKLGKKARFRHGHNQRTTIDYSSLTRSEKISLSKSGKPRPDMVGNKFRLGIPPVNGFKKGEHFSVATEFKKGNKPSKLTIQRVSETSKRLWATDEEYRRKCLLAPRQKKSGTRIELIIESLLTQLKERFEKQYQIELGKHNGKRKVCFSDFYIHKRNLQIFCDGGYFHEIPSRKKLDKFQTQRLKRLGYKVLRMKSREIKKMTLKNFAKLLSRYSPTL